MYTMSKSRIMGAASSGFNYGANKNSPGNGNGKWQGLWPSVGHARNARLINTRAGGDNRNVVFCMNQLGGVGRKSNMFATTADGVKQPCPGSETFFGAAALAAVQVLQEYFSSLGLDMILVGKNETLIGDEINAGVAHPVKFEPLQHFYPGTQEYAALPVTIKNAVDIINGLELKGPLRLGEKPVVHVVGAGTKISLNELWILGYGHKKVKFGPDVFVRMFSKTDFVEYCVDQCPALTTATCILFLGCAALSAGVNLMDGETLEAASVVACAATAGISVATASCLTLAAVSYAS